MEKSNYRKIRRFLLLGYFHFSVSWILLAVLIYLFRQRQRAQFKQRHDMLNQIHANEEQYIKARLEELPSWVNTPVECDGHATRVRFSSMKFLGVLSGRRTRRMGQSHHEASLAVREQVPGQGDLPRRDDSHDSRHVAGAGRLRLRKTRSGRNRTSSSSPPAKHLARCCRLASTHRRHQGLPGQRSRSDHAGRRSLVR